VPPAHERAPVFSPFLPLLEGGATSVNGVGWRVLPVSVLGMKHRQCLAIEAAGFLHLGQLQDHMNEQKQWWGRTITGLGEKGQEAVSNGFVKLFKENPQFCEPEADAPSAESDKPQTSSLTPTDCHE
jgi:hypothetical protein